MAKTVREIAESLSLRLLAGGDEDTLCECVTGGYVGDLLSWVMARAQSGNAWITVMGNINAPAVATLTGCAMIILAENAPLDEEAKAKCDMGSIPVYASEENAYSLAVRLHHALDCEGEL